MKGLQADESPMRNSTPDLQHPVDGKGPIRTATISLQPALPKHGFGRCNLPLSAKLEPSGKVVGSAHRAGSGESFADHASELRSRAALSTELDFPNILSTGNLTSTSLVDT